MGGGRWGEEWNTPGKKALKDCARKSFLLFFLFSFVLFCFVCLFACWFVCFLVGFFLHFFKVM